MSDKANLLFVQDSSFGAFGTGVPTTVLSLPITTNGEQIKIDSMCNFRVQVNNPPIPVSYEIKYSLFRDDQQLVYCQEINNAAGAQGGIYVNLNLNWVDIPPAGSYTYQIIITAYGINVSAFNVYTRSLHAILFS